MNVSVEEQRWLVVLVSSNKIAPALRNFVKQGMDNLYTSLDGHLNGLTAPCSLNTLTYPIAGDPATRDPRLSPLKFRNINNNSDVHGDDKPNYDYKVNSSVDLAKLYLPEYLAKFSAFDESLDMSAILRLLGVTRPAQIFSSSNPFLCIQSIADDVKDNVRNKGAHFDANIWTEGFYDQCFDKLETLVKSMVLPDAVEKTTLDTLSEWKTQGNKMNNN